MTDSSGHQTKEADGSRQPYKQDTKNVPPLVWIIIAVLVVVAIVAVANWHGSTKSPHGASAPAANNSQVNPPATSTPGAPESVTSG